MKYLKLVILSSICILLLGLSILTLLHGIEPKPLPEPTIGAPVSDITGKITDHKISDLKWPEQIGDYRRAMKSNELSGPIYARARYVGTGKINMALQYDVSVKVMGSSLREPLNYGQIRCGRQTETAICMANVGDGMLTVHASDASVTPEVLGNFTSSLAALWDKN